MTAEQGVDVGSYGLFLRSVNCEKEHEKVVLDV